MTNEQQNNSVNVNWEEMDSLITDGNCKVSILATNLSVKPQELRDALREHYGDRIEFRRGRNGGVYWSQNQGE